MEEDFERQDDTGLRLETIEDFGGNVYHLTFDGRVLDKEGDFYDAANISVVLHDVDLSEKSLAQITELGKARLRPLLEKLISMA